MKLPRDISGQDLAKLLAKFGYEIARQTGSHIRMTRTAAPVHHITIPAHDPLKLGTLAAIIGEVAIALRIPRDELVTRLFD